MASIFGIYHFDPQRPADRATLEGMGSVMAHRGRESSLWIDGAVGMGCSANRTNHAGAAVLDGTIHNAGALAADLRSRGHDIPDGSLAALLPALQRTSGSLFPKLLDGFFALALWDAKGNALTLARDRFGVKPLYYRELKDGVAFASEAKALHAITDEKPEIVRSALYEYLTFRSTSGSTTLLSGVHEILPGRSITWRGDQRTETRYWSPAAHYQEFGPSGSTDPEANLAELDRLLRASVDKRIRSGRVGANCSGGVDSGLVTALASSLSSEPITTFTVGFREAEWDERRYAKYITDRYQTRAHEIVIESPRFSELLPRLNWHNDFPLSDPNSVLVHILAEYSRPFVDVLLTGEGADEVFLGYPRYNLVKLYGALRPLPAPLRSLATATLNLSGNRKLRKLASALALPPTPALIQGGAFVSRDLLQELLRNGGISEPEARTRRLEDTRQLDLLPRLMAYEIETYMLSSLNRLDRMSMAAGVEAELPFLDPALFDFALTIPTAQKLTWLDNKKLLRSLAARYLPPENMTMPKSGFGVPIATWLRTDPFLKALLSDLHRDSSMADDFDLPVLRRITSAHDRGEADHAELLWLVISYYIWKKRLQ